MVTTSSFTLHAGSDYPKSWEQFLDWFPDDKSCLGYLEKIRWPDGFICPRCHSKNIPYYGSRGRLICRSCRYEGSVIAGSIFEKTRTPLRIWFAAVWYITNQKYGVSALGLKRVLGLGSYQTAWTMLHRLRYAMVRPGREKLSGLVEVDETYIGGRDTGKIRAPQPESKKSIVAVAVEIHQPKGFGRIRLRRLNSATQEEVLPFICESIEPGSVVRSDGSAIYQPVSHYGYRWLPTVQLGASDPAHVNLPGVHRVASLLKRWLLGTHQGAVRAQHLEYYLDEFTFRFNRRASQSRGLLFYRLLEQAVTTEHVSYQKIVENGKHYM